MSRTGEAAVRALLLFVVLVLLAGGPQVHVSGSLQEGHRFTSSAAAAQDAQAGRAGRGGPVEGAAGRVPVDRGHAEVGQVPPRRRLAGGLDSLDAVLPEPAHRLALAAPGHEEPVPAAAGEQLRLDLPPRGAAPAVPVPEDQDAV